MNWDSNRIRQTFLDFFQSKEHEIVPSAPMVVKDDPTLLFINAGMNPFKDYFLGNRAAEQPRVADTQKCLRVSGKHNDLEEVGVDTYHHTMFEMLGNWSFGDYFKSEAISWAWELLTDVYGIDKNNLYVTVFGGDESDNLPEDAEAVELWRKHVPEDRILRCSRKDNFWEMGDTGPCGPSSEIHIDLRSEAERAEVDARTLVNQDHPLVIELWNLVFIQYNRMASGDLASLPKKHIDTGMGLERLAMVLQGKQSNYDTDIFRSLIGEVEKLSGHTYGASMEKPDIAGRVIADHVRAIAFSIADGQLPSNTGAGYVIRRILRRAVRYGYSFLGMDRSFLHQLVPQLVANMGDTFPELKAQQTLIQQVVKEEEENFLRTLERGIQRFGEYRKHHHQVKGDFAFELYDTFGFPIDLTQLMAAEHGLTVDIDGFQRALQKQKDRSRKATAIQAGDWVELLEDDHEEFIGYDYLEADILLTRYRKVTVKGQDRYQLVFNMTPFYPEGGGQVGDSGFIRSEHEQIPILTTRKENNLIIHITDRLPEHLQSDFRAVVSAEKRENAARNHTATHLLHQALREVLGEHVEQKGSLVHPDYLRFDFSHFQKVDNDQLREVENRINARILNNLALDEQRAIPLVEAKEMGAMSLFGEKYADVVRVIRFGDSIELCGGTHAPRTGNLGLFKFTAETAVAAGVRRVEGVTGTEAYRFVNDRIDLLDELRNMFKNSKNLMKSITGLVEDNEVLKQDVQRFARERAQRWKQRVAESLQEVNGVQFAALEVDMTPDRVKDIAFQLKAEVDSLFLVLGTRGEKATLTVIISDDLAKERDYNAGQLIREWAKAIRGGGGGQPFYATAGGSYPDGLDEAFNQARTFIGA